MDSRPTISPESPEVLMAQGRCPYCGWRTVVEGRGQVCGSCVRKRQLAVPHKTDEEIVAYVVARYSKDMAESVLAALRTSGTFGEHVRQSYLREMAERGL